MLNAKEKGETVMNFSKSKGPLYIQIKEVLKDRILHGEYAIDTIIPSEPQLEKEFNVSKITIRNAVKELVQEGYLEKRSGVGTKVVANISTAKISKGKRFTELLVEEGYNITKKVLSIDNVNLTPDTALYSIFGAHCLRIDRVYYLNQEAYIYFSHYVKLDMTEEMEDIPINSLYRFLEENNIRLESFRDEFTVAAAPQYVSEILKLDDETAVFKRMRQSSDVNGNIVEYSEGYYDTRKHNYTVTYNDFN